MYRIICKLQYYPLWLSRLGLDMIDGIVHQTGSICFSTYNSMYHCIICSCLLHCTQCICLMCNWICTESHILRNLLLCCTLHSQMKKRHCMFCKKRHIRNTQDFVHCRSTHPCICMNTSWRSICILIIWSSCFHKQCTKMVYMSCIENIMGSIQNRINQYPYKSSH